MSVTRQIHRFARTPHGTLGRLGPWCVLEEEWQGNQRNISSIPADTYLVRRTWSPTFGKLMWEVLDVPNRTGIRFHPLATEEDTDGCIGLGQSFHAIQVPDEDTGIVGPKIALLRSRTAHREFEAELEADLAAAGVDEWTLIITES